MMFVSKKIFHQTLACSPVILLSILNGFFWGWMPPTMAKLNDRNSGFYVTPEQASWFASINELGRVTGPFVSPILLDNIGRKYTLIIVAVIYLMFWLSIIFVRNIHIVYVLLVMYGFGNGINNVGGGIYTTENCSPNFRGIIGSIILLSYYASVMVECVIATYLSYQNAAIVNTLFTVFVFASFYFSTETPYFLIMKGERKKAKENLIWLSGSMALEKKTDDELQRIEQNIEVEKQKKQSFKKLVSSRANLRGILVVVGMMAFGMASGVSGVYSSLIFEPSEIFTTEEFMILFTAAQFFAVVISPFIVEKVNRRSIMIGGNVGATLSNICSFLLMYFRGRGYQIMYFPWLIFGSITVHSMCGSIRAPAGYTLRGELLPFSVRAIGSSMAVLTGSLTSFVVTKAFLPITECFGMETNFLIYSIVNLSGTIFIYCVLPETRGKALHELQNSKEVKRNNHQLEEVVGTTPTV